jgi:hypothetical protein
MRVSPILIYGSESCHLTTKDKNILRIFERMIYSPIKENCIWRSRCNHKLYKLYNEPDILKVISAGRLIWLGQPFRKQEQNPSKKLALYKPEGIRRTGRPAIRRLDSVEGSKKK